MKTRTVIGLASALVKGRKFKMALVGVQLVYMAYNYRKQRKNEKQLKANN